MKPRFAEDYRLLFWMLVLMPMSCLASLLAPPLGLVLLPLNLYFTYCCAIASHNHNHCPTFTSPIANALYGGWLSIFYGYPIFAWIPTHNQNHHKYVNGPGDDTRTTRYAPRDTWWRAMTYPMASIIYQSPAITRYLVAHYRRAMAGQRRRALLGIVFQYAALVSGHALAFGIATGLHGFTLGCVAYALALGIPALFAIWAVLLTNYLQHVGCDAASKHDHSRNFVGQRTNWWLFNAGYHTVHHEHPGTHWSRYPAMHAARAGLIHPRLNQPTLFSYCWNAYVHPAEQPCIDDDVSFSLDVRTSD